MRRILSFLLTFLLPATVGVLNGQTGTAPVIAQSPIDVTTTAGGVASFRVTAMGTAPLAYQWFHDSQPIAGATMANLVLDQIGASEAGRYFVTVGNSLGTATSSFATLVVLPQTLPSIVDATFRGDARLDGAPTAILPLADGRVLLADGLKGKLVRLLADGRLDPAFVPGAPEALFGGFDAPRIWQIAVHPDGKILVTGLFRNYGGIPRPGLVRLNADGTVDESFSPPADLATFSSRYSADVVRVAATPDGRVLILDDYHRLVRLLTDGRRDSSFVLPGIDLSSVVAFAAASDGRVFVSTGTGVMRFLPDGTADQGFSRNAASLATVSELAPLADGRLLVGTKKIIGGGRFSEVSYGVVRLLVDGSVDPAFPALTGTLGIPPAADGTMLRYDGMLVAPDGSSKPLNLGILSYPDGIQTGVPSGYLAAFAPDGRIFFAGPFSFYNGVATSRIVRLNRVPVGVSVASEAPRVLDAWSDANVLTNGQTTMLRVAAIGPGPLTYRWTRGLFVVQTSAPTYSFTPWRSYEEGDWTVRAINAAGSATSPPFHVAVRPAALRIVEQPTRVSLMSGRDATLRVNFASGSEPSDRSDVWRRDGKALSVSRSDYYGDSVYAAIIDHSAALFLKRATTALAGTYTVTVTNAAGQTVTSAPIVVSVDDVSRFVNLSTRAWVGAGEQAAVLGFVIPAGQTRSLILRGVGPTLANFGVPGVLADARLELFDGTGRRLFANDNWVDFLPHRTFAEVGAFELPANSLDANIDANLGPGNYTVRLSGPPGATGIGLIELYESDNASDRLLNVSSRVFIGPGATPAIAGFAIRGPVAKRILVRAIGPGLGAFGVRAPLVNPRLEIRDAAGALVASNDDWQTQTDPAGVAVAAAGAGAFALAPGSKDAALVISLPPGNFTALVAAADGGSGIALVEVYELP